jgi:hypothetical protein
MNEYADSTINRCRPAVLVAGVNESRSVSNSSPSGRGAEPPTSVSTRRTGSTASGVRLTSGGS